jgi:hypothetical protein
MADDFVIPMKRTVTEEQVEATQPEMHELAIVRGELAPDGTLLSPTLIVANFRAVDEATGRYRDDTETKQFRVTDYLPTEAELLEDPERQPVLTASLARAALLAAVIPSTPEFVAAGLAGMTIRQAGMALFQGS